MDREPVDSGRIYTVTQRLAAMTTAPNELMSLLASSQSKVELMRLELGQLTTSTLTPMVVEMFRHSSLSTGGSTAGGSIVPIPTRGHVAAPASTSVVVAASTVPHSTAAASRVHADTFAADSGKFAWAPPFPIVVDANQRFSLRLTPLTTAALNGIAMTATFRELGKIPSS